MIALLYLIFAAETPLISERHMIISMSKIIRSPGPLIFKVGNPCIGKMTSLYWNGPSSNKFPDFSLTNFQTIPFRQDINHIQVFKMKPWLTASRLTALWTEAQQCEVLHILLCRQLKLLAPLVEIFCACFSPGTLGVTRTLARFATWHIMWSIKTKHYCLWWITK